MCHLSACVKPVKAFPCVGPHVISGKEVVPLGRIRLNITFSRPDSSRKEALTFKMVNFPSIYHTLLGGPCFAKFMAILNYTYLKLKMPDPNWVITIKGSFDQDCVTQAAALSASCGPTGYGRDAGRASVKEGIPATATLD
jgi:hypothetical protein